jgi:cyclophilin family peptidyl-prolyl cis-trans isomerase
MQQLSKSHDSIRAIAAAALTILVAAFSACGGGGGGASSGGTPTATVTAMVANASRYASAATVTINGTGLDSTLAVTSSVCTGMALQSGSTSTTATYSCTVSGGLTGSVIAKSNGTQVGSATLTVPAPIVRMMVNNGLSAVGNIDITLAPDKAPKTVDNFLHYANTGFYNQTIFHRVVSGFIMQGGGYAPQITDVSTATLKTGLFAPIAVESTGLSNVTWSISMANSNNPPSVDSITTTSEFFFNLGNNTALDGYYPVFGSITAGTTVVQAIIAAPSSCVPNSAAQTTDCLPVPNAVVTSATQIQ